MEGRSCLISLIAFCDKMTGSMDEGSFLILVRLLTLFHNILRNKPMKYRLDKQAVRWIKNGLN